MSSRPWLDAIDNPAVEQQLVQAKPAVTTPANPKRIAPQNRVHLWGAVICDGKLPDRDAFIRVGCVQMTGQSAAFIWPGACSADMIMLAVGTTSKASYLQTKVVERTLLPDGTTHLACEFVKRY